MIKVKNHQLDNETIDIINRLIDMEINATTAFKLSRIIKELSSIVDDKIKMEQKILEKWAKRDEFGNIMYVNNGENNSKLVDLADPESFSSEMKELMELENHINYDRINFEDMGLGVAKVKDLIKLDFLFF